MLTIVKLICLYEKQFNNSERKLHGNIFMAENDVALLWTDAGEESNAGEENNYGDIWVLSSTYPLLKKTNIVTATVHVTVSRPLVRWRIFICFKDKAVMLDKKHLACAISNLQS